MIFEIELSAPSWTTPQRPFLAESISGELRMVMPRGEGPAYRYASKVFSSTLLEARIVGGSEQEPLMEQFAFVISPTGPEVIRLSDSLFAFVQDHEQRGFRITEVGLRRQSVWGDPNAEKWFEGAKEDGIYLLIKDKHGSCAIRSDAEVPHPKWIEEYLQIRKPPCRAESDRMDLSIKLARETRLESYGADSPGFKPRNQIPKIDALKKEAGLGSTARMNTSNLSEPWNAIPLKTKVAEDRKLKDKKAGLQAMPLPEYRIKVDDYLKRQSPGDRLKLDQTCVRIASPSEREMMLSDTDTAHAIRCNLLDRYVLSLLQRVEAQARNTIVT